MTNVQYQQTSMSQILSKAGGFFISINSFSFIILSLALSKLLWRAEAINIITTQRSSADTQEEIDEGEIKRVEALL